MIANSQLTSIDLFAGCGGLSLGLEQAGFFPLYVNELNHDAMQTYLINRDKDYPHLRDEMFHSRDIKKIIQDPNFFRDLFLNLHQRFNRDFRKYPVDIVAGGPPCQGFSGIGIRRSYSVDKEQLPSNHLYQDMAFFIHNVKPKMFLFENVEGLLTAKWTKDGIKGEIFDDVLNTFKRIPGYSVRYKLIHAKDYGVPQNRPRVLIIGIRTDRLAYLSFTRSKFRYLSMKCDDAMDGGFLPEPTNDYPHIEELLSDLENPNFEYGGSTSEYISEPTNDWQKHIRTTSDHTYFKKGESLSEQEYSKHSDKVKERFAYMISHDGQIPDHLRTKKFAQRLLPRRWKDKGPSITTCSLADDFVHYSEPRTLTVREWARLQTFPDWYQFAGNRTTGGLRRAGNPREQNFEREVPKYTQIGNAVPVKLGYELGKHFRSIIGGDYEH